LRAQLDRLRVDYGVDGFKLDGGHFQCYPASNRIVNAKGATSAQQNRAYAIYAEDYPMSEHRNVWGMAGRPVMVRLPDKGNTWPELRRLVPDMLAAGLLGYPFICPDMIGGGLWTAYLPGSKTPYDKELFIRSAQVHALCPMMQFSISPWRLMKDDPDGQRIIRNIVELRQRFAPKFVELARRAGETGEPMMRPMEYVYPRKGYAKIRDQFMMGEDLLVAPVLEKGAKSRRVVIPQGSWRGDDGEQYVGPTVVEVSAPLERLPYFINTGRTK
jgi:alpha-glucosidase